MTLSVMFSTITPRSTISAPEVENFEKNGVYEAADAVKVDLVGGVAIQKVSPERSYLR